MSCFKCGLQGHFARECMEFFGHYPTNSDLFINANRNEDMLYNQNSFPHNNNAGNGPQRCYRCNEFGHIARECLSNNDIRTCYNCGQNGHISTECGLPSNPMLNTSSNSRASAQCYRCAQYGHLARECLATVENNGVLNDRICFNCSRTGHIAAACPEYSRTDMRDVTCYCCNRPGHLSRNCPDSEMKCYSCGLKGHMARDCTNNRSFSGTSTVQQDSIMFPQQIYSVHMPMIN